MRIVFDLNEKQEKLMAGLLKTGLFGKTREEAALRLIDRSLVDCAPFIEELEPWQQEDNE